MVDIFDIEFSYVKDRIEDMGASVTISQSAKDFLAERGYSEEFGARPLKRMMQNLIESPLAKRICESSIPKDKMIISLSHKKGREDVTISIKSR
jgi:ATP-dependent Clp protease ATP-binding subunit ClpC